MWYRWSRVVQRRPWPAAIGGLAFLLVLAIPLLSMRLAFPDSGANPKADTSRQAYDLVAEGFGPGFNGPLVLAAEFPKGADTAALDRAGDPSAADARRRRGRRADPEPVRRRRRHPRDPDELAAVGRDHRPRRHPARRRHPRRGERLRRAGARRWAHRVEHRRVGTARGAAADLHRRGARAQLPPADGRVPQPARPAQGRDHEPAVDRRRVRRGRRGVRVGLGERHPRRREDRAHRAVHPDDDVRHPLRALDGLRGLPALAHPGGVRPHRRQRGRRRRRPGVDRHGSSPPPR